MSNADWAAMIHLDQEDRAKAWACAKEMVRDAKSWGWTDRFGQDSTESHYWGALGEIAFAKFRGVEWHCHSGDGAITDVDGYEVRAISPTARVYVKTKKKDKPGTRIAFVVHLSGGEAALIVGWTTVEIIRQYGTLEDPGNRKAPAYMLHSTARLNRDFPPRLDSGA